MTQEQKNQLNDREQFRRYAEAALAGMTAAPRPFDDVAGEAFAQAASMMLAEGHWFEQYQLEVTARAIDEERKRQGIEPPYTDPS